MAGHKLSSNGLPLDHYANCALKEPFQSFKVSLVTKITSKVNRLESESAQLLKQTAGVVRISWQAYWIKSSICTLGFSIPKCFISFRQRLEMSKGKNTFHEWKRSKQPSISCPRAKHTRFKPTLTSGKRLLWYFWCAMLEVKKKTRLKYFK